MSNNFTAVIKLYNDEYKLFKKACHISTPKLNLITVYSELSVAVSNERGDLLNETPTSSPSPHELGVSF